MPLQSGLWRSCNPKVPFISRSVGVQKMKNYKVVENRITFATFYPTRDALSYDITIHTSTGNLGNGQFNSNYKGFSTRGMTKNGILD
ncbi:hypothetical protein LX77_00680 [Gelidibacter algens]|uniref:Uncharacterized protein n=1 Tax=Gelidibacter algens TaxID=49280 RepID=A0A327SBW8_9FLAO|nr:hypothetical protein LX77_00680 [Gelidibacter algens]